MTKISYEQFLIILSKYDKFDSIILNALYDEFGKKVINNYFEKYFDSLDEDKIDNFVIKYSAFFDAVSLDIETREIDDYDSRGIISPIVHRSYKFPLMSSEFEKEQGLVLIDCKKKLKIVSNYDNMLELYPRLDLAKLFLSVKDENDLEVLSSIIKIPYSYDDDSILKDEIPLIRRYLRLCSNGIPDKSKLKKEFPNLCFDNVCGLNDLEQQVDLLKKLIYAKFNFYNRNLRLVISYSKKFCKKHNFEEKLQEGCIGLIRAINNYNASLECRFSTYATSSIVQCICRYVANNGFMIRKPVYLYDAINKYNRFVSNFVAINGFEPTFEDCLNGLGFSDDFLNEIQNESLDVVSLDAPLVGDDGEDDIFCTIADRSISFEDEILAKDNVKFIRKQIYSLFYGREREILLNRLGLDTSKEKMTLEELGMFYGITRERVRQIEFKCKRRLKTMLKFYNIE